MSIGTSYLNRAGRRRRGERPQQRERRGQRQGEGSVLWEFSHLVRFTLSVTSLPTGPSSAGLRSAGETPTHARPSMATIWSLRCARRTVTALAARAAAAPAPPAPQRAIWTAREQAGGGGGHLEAVLAEEVAGLAVGRRAACDELGHNHVAMHVVDEHRADPSELLPGLHDPRHRDVGERLPDQLHGALLRRAGGESAAQGPPSAAGSLARRVRGRGGHLACERVLDLEDDRSARLSDEPPPDRVLGDVFRGRPVDGKNVVPNIYPATERRRPSLRRPGSVAHDGSSQARTEPLRRAKFH